MQRYRAWSVWPLLPKAEYYHVFQPLIAQHNNLLCRPRLYTHCLQLLAVRSNVLTLLTLLIWFFHLVSYRGIFPISDNFRVVGLAEHTGATQVDLLSDPELVSMFLFHNVKPLDMEGERKVILSKVRCLWLILALERHRLTATNLMQCSLGAFKGCQCSG